MTVAGGRSPGDSQAAVADRNSRISTLNTGAAVSYVAGGVFLAAGVLLLLWPNSPPPLAGSF
jgi:hypothetical protein